MRRFFVGMAILSMSAATPMIAWGDDREIRDQLVASLKQHQDRGALKGFTIDLKVDGGAVEITGTVRDATQHDLVLATAREVTGVTNVIDQLEIAGERDFSMQQALQAGPVAAAPVAAPVQPVSAASEVPQNNGDAAISQAVASALNQAKQRGELRGFGLDVSCVEGDVWLRGQVASPSQKEKVLDIVRRTAGVRNVVDDISITSAVPQADPTVMQPIDIQPVAQVSSNEPAQFQPAVTAAPVPAMVAPYRPVQGMPVPFAVASTGGAGMADPNAMPMPAVPINSGYGAPRYDQPNMPNYAWPGYASYPNYAAVTYPQQYSPTAWPYIGPFYPYPQVPLGWRKVTLEWDDGWWFLDFNSKK